MKKRIRKKKRMGEFVEYGFYIKASAPSLLGAKDETIDKFNDEFICFAESNGCGIGGIIGPNIDVFYSKIGRGSCNENDREGVRKFLLNNSLVTDFDIGPLVNAWE